MKTVGIRRHRTELEQLEGFRVIMDNLPVGCSIINFDRRYVFANKVVSSRLGLEQKDIIGKRVLDILPNMKKHGMYSVLEKCLKERKHGHIETDVPRGASTVSIDFSVQPIPVGAFMLTIDKTKEKKAESDLVRSEEEHRSSMDISPLIVFIVQDKLCKYANSSFYDRLGYTFEEISDPSFDLIEKIVAPKFRKLANVNRKMAEKGKFMEGHDLALMTITGQEIDVFTSQRTVTFQGRLALEIVCQDISERKRAEEQLRKSEESHNASRDISPLLIMVRQDIVCKYVNKTIIDRLGYSFEELSDPSFDFINRIIAPRFRKQARSDLKNRIVGKIIPVHESALITRSGEELDIIVIQKPTTFQGKPATEFMMEDFTERKRADEKLRKSEEEYRSFLDSSPFFVSIRQDGVCKYANKTIVDRLGYSLEELADPSFKPVETYIAPRFHKTVRENRKKRKAGLVIPRHEAALVTHSGQEIAVLATQRTTTFQGRVAVEYLYEDITERKDADEKLRKSEEEYMSFLDRSPLFVTIYQDGICKYSNKTHIDRLGYSLEELSDPLFSPIDTLIASRFHKQARKNQKFSTLGEVVSRHESAFVTRNGEEIEIMIGQRPITFQGKPALEIMAEDISEKKRADKERDESEKRYRRLFDSSAVGNWSQDLGPILRELDKLSAAGIKDFRAYFHQHPGEAKSISRRMRMIEVNQTALEMFGARSTKELMMGASHLFSKVSLENGVKFLVAVTEGAQSYGMDFSCNTLDGRDIEVRTFSNISPRVKANQLMIVNAIDVTESKRHEVEKLSAVGKAAASIAHDVRNPLTVIRNAAYIIRSAKKEKRDEMLEVIDNNTVRADNIIQSLMDFSSPAPLETTEVNFNTTLDEILTQTVIPTNVKLTKKYDNNLAARYDKSQITRAFSNLLMNALQAMPKGGRLTVSSKQVDGFIETQIIDTGVGIPKKNLTKLFTPFFTTKAKGTGLGLPNAEAIVQRHKGTLKVESIEKESTTVTVRLPALDK